MSAARRRRLRKNLRSLHPLPPRRFTAEEDKAYEDAYREALRLVTVRMVRQHSLPSWLFRAIMTAGVVSLVAAVIALHHQ